MMRIMFAVLAMLSLLAPVFASAAEGFGRYHALVIGVADYRKMPKLETPINDASAVHDLLRRQYGFQSTLLLNPRRDELIGAIDALRSELTEHDNLLIYFAGHGVLERETGTGFWLPVEADPESQVSWIEVPTITRMLAAMSAHHVMVVADSCYSGTLVRAAPNRAASGGSRQATVERLASKRSRTALVSGGLEPVMDSGGHGHSVFARAFLETLRDNETILEGSALHLKVRQPVILAARQTPEYSDVRFAGHEGGDFLFVPRGLSLETATPGAAARAPAAVDKAPLIDESALDLAFWESVKGTKDAAGFEAYLRRFPSGTFAALAKQRLAALSASRRPPSEPFAGHWKGKGLVGFSSGDGCPSQFSMIGDVADSKFTGKAFVGSRTWQLSGLISPDGTFSGSISGPDVGRISGRFGEQEASGQFSDNYGECAGRFNLSRSGD